MKTLQVGDIYLYKNFKFKDRKTANKFLVVINSPIKEVCIVCKTTSQEKPPYTVRKRGCSEEYSNYMLFKLIFYSPCIQFNALNIVGNTDKGKNLLKLNLKPKRSF